MNKLERFTLVLLGTMLLTAGFALYTAVYFSHHDSIYAEGCPEQRTLFWCGK